jgi:hypothetical protein
MGSCSLVGCEVWSRRVECAGLSHGGGTDLFEGKDTLGNRLRAARLAAGLTQTEVAAAFYCSVKAVQTWEHDTRKVSKFVEKSLFDFYESERQKNKGHSPCS